MSFLRYLKDNYRLLIFYSVLMIFILMVIYLDRNNRVLGSNITYIAVVSFLMFLIFLLWDYRMKYKHVKELLKLKESEDKTPIFPEAIEFKDEVYSSVVSDLYNSYSISLKTIENEFIENNEFMTAWVHEIKTPITTSKLLIENTEARDTSFAASIKDEIEKIDDYVEKVLYYSRSDNFSMDYIIAEESVGNLVKESVKKHSLIFIRKHISFKNDIKGNLSIETDKKWLLFIMDQIISNALKYTEPGGVIRVSSSEDDNERILIIEDNGCGIKKEDIERLFTKSFTGNNGRIANNKATGLGLYLSQKLAKKLGHYITIQSEYGKGTSVYVHFPKWNDYYITKM